MISGTEQTLQDDIQSVGGVHGKHHPLRMPRETKKVSRRLPTSIQIGRGGQGKSM
jgi:hypothetical protein